MPNRTLHVAPTLTLPVDVVTQPLGMFANRGMGKSNAAHRLVEQLYHAGLPSVVLDVKGDWYGIRSSADGRRAGLPFLIFGGTHGDVPLEAGSGAHVARLLAAQRVPAIVDLFHFSKTAARRWVMEFAEELYRVNTEPLMLVVDEADVLIPQRLAAELMRLLGAMEDIAKRGRQRGLGVLVISQRVADVNKSVTDLLDTLFVFSVTGTRTRKAILDWIDDHGDAEQAKSVVNTLSSLEPGECWVWSPGWLKLLKRIHVSRIETFDSHATPKAGEVRSTIRTMADVDLAAITEQMAATIERAKAEDPKELRRRIAELERIIANTPVSVPEVIQEMIPFVPHEIINKLKDHREALTRLASTITDVIGAAQEVGWPDSPPPPPRTQPRTSERTNPVEKSMKPQVKAPPRADTNGDTPVVTGPMRKLLVVLATYGPRTKRQLAMQAGYAMGGGAFNNPLGALRSGGLIEPAKGEPMAITAAGLAALGEYDPLPSGAALLEHWMGQLKGPERKILLPLVDIYPKTLTKDELAAAAGYAPTGGAFGNPLGHLRTLELVTRGADIGLTEEFAEAIDA